MFFKLYSLIAFSTHPDNATRMRMRMHAYGTSTYVSHFLWANISPGNIFLCHIYCVSLPSIGSFQFLWLPNIIMGVLIRCSETETEGKQNIQSVHYICNTLYLIISKFSVQKKKKGILTSNNLNVKDHHNLLRLKINITRLSCCVNSIDGWQFCRLQIICGREISNPIPYILSTLELR